jgi:hypothetical protein
MPTAHFVLSTVRKSLGLDGKYSLAIAYLLALAIFYGVTYPNVMTLSTGGDNQAYIGIAKALAKGLTASSSNQITPDRVSLGYPLLLSPFLIKNDVNPYTLLLVVNVIIGFLNCLLIEKIFGRKVAFFSISGNLALTQRTFLGGVEPLFMFLGLLSIYFSARRAYLAAAFAALSFWVRPFGIFFIFGIFCDQICRKIGVKKFIGSLLICALVVGMYLGAVSWFYSSLRLVVGGGYQGNWDSGTPYGIPFAHIIHQFLMETRVTSFFKVAVYFVLSFVPFYCMAQRVLKEKTLSALRVYDWMYVPFLFFVYQLNSYWGYVEFLRYTSPVFPVAVFYARRFLPNNLLVAYFFLIVFSAAAALSIKGAIASSGY